MSWLQKWEPENPEFWQSTGASIAWRTLTLTTISLIFSFATWFVISAAVVRLPQVGFKFDTMQLFWLAAMPGLAGGTLRLVHSFLIPILGTRRVISVATLIKIIPMVWLFYAVQDLSTPFWVFICIAFLCGMGGGDFSSYMPSSSLFFPKRLQGVAMGIQAGVGNFGVSLVQFITPWIIGFAAFGAVAGGPQLFTKADAVKDVVVTKEAGVVKDVVVKNPDLASTIIVTKDDGGVLKDVVKQEAEANKNIALTVKRDDKGVITDVAVKKVIKKDIWLQNAAIWYVVPLIVMGILCALFLKSVPIKASFKQQLDIMPVKHTWFCVITYIMTFGSFAGFSAAFPLMIGKVYGGFSGAPDPLKYAFYGPLIGSVARVVFGPPSDKWGGSIFVQIAGIGQIVCALALIFGGYLTPTSLDQFNGFVVLMLLIFFFAGIGNAATFRQYPIIFAYSPRQGAQVLGWTGAWAAYGPFIFATLIGYSMTKTGNAVAFFWGAAIFYVIASIINWWFYTKPGAERGDWGATWGTWWDTAKNTWTAK